MTRYRIKQTRSVIGRPESQRATLKALGLRGINQEVEQDGSPQIIGMIRKISHLVIVEEIK